MKILLSGGGTGGHITPIVAVAHELKQQQPNCQILYIAERGGKFDELTNSSNTIDKIYNISAGKFRRYYGENIFIKLFDFKTLILNILDFFKFLNGLVQSWFIISREKPNVVFLKGGFVGVPVGLVAAFKKIPIVTHDSDALPGLANRIISRWVNVHATALPAKYYSYDHNKVKPVGVLVEHNYQYVTKTQLKEFKSHLGYPDDSFIILVTGGSSGAEKINKAIVSIIDDLLRQFPNLYIIHQVGKGKKDVYGQYRHKRLNILEFLNPMYEYMGAADLVVTRSSGNTMAELGVQGKPCIAIPNAKLTGGHQTKNAEILKKQNAALVIDENKLYDEQQGLKKNIMVLINDEKLRSELSTNLRSITIVGAASKLARLLLQESR